MGRKRERQTLVPAFDPEALAKELESEHGASASERPTSPPPFDPTSYARIVDAHVDAVVRDTPRTMTAALKAAETEVESGRSVAGFPTGLRAEGVGDDEVSRAFVREDAESIGRAMYGSYLESDFPAALVLAERVLQKQPDHSLAQLVAERCRTMMDPQAGVGSGEDSGSAAPRGRLQPSSIVRVRQPLADRGVAIDMRSMFVLGHVDGVSDAGTVAELSGIPKAEALDRLHALLDLGVLELIA